MGACAPVVHPFTGFANGKRGRPAGWNETLCLHTRSGSARSAAPRWLAVPAIARMEALEEQSCALDGVPSRRMTASHHFQPASPRAGSARQPKTMERG
jgi:hypothetical protein